MKQCHLQQHRECHTEWSKSDRQGQILYDSAYMWEKIVQWTYLQNRNKASLCSWMWEIPWLLLSIEQGGSNITPFPESFLLGQVATASWLLEGNHHVQRETTQKPPYHEKPKPHTVVVQSSSCDRLFAIPWTAAARLPCPSPAPGVCSDSCPLSWWCHSAISSSIIPSPPALSLSQNQGLFQWAGSSHQVVKVLTTWRYCKAQNHKTGDGALRTNKPRAVRYQTYGEGSHLSSRFLSHRDSRQHLSDLRQIPQ